MRKTKIVSTIGPASDSLDMLQKLIKAGVNVTRLNFSHGSFAEHEARINTIKQAAENMDKEVAILLDTQGPEIRTETFQDGEANIVEGQTVNISTKTVVGTAEKFSITYSGLIDDVDIGNKILVDDGLIELEVIGLHKAEGIIETTALNSGVVSNNKGVNVPNVSVNLPAMTDKDVEDIKFGIEQDVDFIAASFIRRQSDVIAIKNLLEENEATNIQIIAKIENQEGVDRIDEILEVADGIMVARGDLGVEIPAEDVPLVQKHLINKCNLAGKPVITATQMLDSMQRNPRPTRAEASDVANAIFDGTDAIMLSGETAIGDYPVETVETMSDIALKSEKHLQDQWSLDQDYQVIQATMTDAISQSVTQTAMHLRTSAIITPTESGYTARMIAKYRPHVPIIAVTFSECTNRQLALVWGVYPIKSRPALSIDELFDISVECALNTDLYERGSVVVITAGVPVGESGTTNVMKIHGIGDVITKGIGSRGRNAYGKAVIANNSEEAIANVEEGDILITYATDRDMMPAIEKAVGLVTIEGGLTSHAAVVGLSLGIPVIVGVKNAFELIKSGTYITIDSSSGDIYDGHASVL